MKEKTAPPCFDVEVETDIPNNISAWLWGFPMKLHFTTGLGIVPQHFQGEFVIPGLGSTFYNFPIDS